MKYQNKRGGKASTHPPATAAFQSDRIDKGSDEGAGGIAGVNS